MDSIFSANGTTIIVGLAIVLGIIAAVRWLARRALRIAVIVALLTGGGGGAVATHTDALCNLLPASKGCATQTPAASSNGGAR